jgi:hypothetical protein
MAMTELMHAREAYEQYQSNRDKGKDAEELKQWDEVVSKINKAVEYGRHRVDTGLNLFGSVRARLTSLGYEVEAILHHDIVGWYKPNQYWE